MAAARRGILVQVLVLVVLLALPWVVDAYAISTASKILTLGLVAVAVNVLTGFTGLPHLGMAAYFGVGAYTGAIVAIQVTALGPVQLVAAALAGAVAAVATGSLAVRARGVPFLMITLAIGEIAHHAAQALDSITHGTDGLRGIPRVVPLPGMVELKLDGLVYYYVLAMFLIVFGLVAVVMRSPFGHTLGGIRDNEARMRAIGYPTDWYVLAGYTFAGAVAGAAGSLWTTTQRFVAPGDLGFEISALALLAVILGGVRSLWGSVLGMALVLVARDYLGPDLGGHSPLLLGLLFVGAVYLLPRGLAGIRPRRPLNPVPEEVAG